MTLFFQNVVNGLLLGGLFVCIGIGFSLVWGVLGIINLAHGSLIVLGSYVAYFAFTQLGVSPFISFILVMPIMFCFGYALQRGILNRIVGRSVLMTLTLTFGLDLILYNSMLSAFSADFRRVVLPHALGSLDIWGLIIPVDRLLATGLALLLTLLFYFLLRWSKTGRAIIAVRSDSESAVLMGVNVERIYAITFGIGAAFAGAAGAVLSVVFPISAVESPQYLGTAFVVVILGGLGSTWGVLVGGMTLGVIESLGVMVFGPENSSLIGFLVLLMVLTIKPTGLVGQAGFE